ncbi:MAG: PEGA domain-containing protein [Treponema sp.]|jgi:hypothetical protein|nr:PEGA domain-containing protein [Treponema sp.]
MNVKAESIRVIIAGIAEISPDRPEGTTISLTYLDSALIRLRGETRFLRGIQLDLTAPQGFLAYRGSLASVLYAGLNANPSTGIADLEAQQLSSETLPNRILNTWIIPVHPAHGLRSSPYVTIPTGVVNPSSFPMIFRLMPVIKGITQELERMVFQLQIRPILSDEGAIRINFIYPDQIPVRPVIVLIDDELIVNPLEALFLREGEHNLVILSDDYRNQSRRFMVERARFLDLTVELQDPAPLLIFEHPEGARVFVNNIEVANTLAPYPVAPGQHEIRFQMSNYSIIRPITVQRGKTYRIALSVDVDITEND